MKFVKKNWVVLTLLGIAGIAAYFLLQKADDAATATNNAITTTEGNVETAGAWAWLFSV
jgi:hypothetical protein